MKKITTIVGGVALGCCMVASVAQAASIQSLTIEEIGLASSGLGTSGNLSLGGETRAYDANGILFTGNPFHFVSAGSADGSIIMGSMQGNDAFTLGFFQEGGPAGELNTSRGAPNGSITNGIMTLDLSGFTAEFGGYSFALGPDNNLVVAASMIDANHYYYTADWSHVVKDGEVFNLTTNATYLGFTGWTLAGHLEGVAVVPEAETYAMMLAGLGLVGLMAYRRRRLV
jgi:hypothetical protein